jgi:hypothetical protein
VADDVVGTEAETVTKVELDAHLAQLEKYADLGSAVGPSERFRLAKRVVYKLSWPFLRRQIDFNHAVVQSHRELAQRMTRLQDRIEQDLRDDLLDFADRSASQAHAEIGSYVAEARSVNAGLVLELRSLQAELDTMLKMLSGRAPSEAAEVDTGADESHR